MKVRREVYEKAKHKCQRCKKKLPFERGRFHHTRDPTISSRAKSIRFLCPNCHEWYGHKWSKAKGESIFGIRTTGPRIIRKDLLKKRRSIKKTELAKKKIKTKTKKRRSSSILDQDISIRI